MSKPRPLVGPSVVGLLLALTLGAPAWSLAQSASGPLVSPDGKSIVFTREPARGNPVHVIAHIDGSNERVLATTPLDRIQWLGDSRRLVFQKTRSREGVTLEVIPAGGAEPKPFGRLPGEVEAVSPDGTWAVSLLGEWPIMRLSRVHLDGTAEKPLVTGQGVGLGSVAISPDGRRVFFMLSGSAGRTLRVVNADGTNLRDIVTFDRADGTPEMPSWSPDGPSSPYRPGATTDRILPRTPPTSGSSMSRLAHGESSPRTTTGRTSMKRRVISPMGGSPSRATAPGGWRSGSSASMEARSRSHGTHSLQRNSSFRLNRETTPEVVSATGGSAPRG